MIRSETPPACRSLSDYVAMFALEDADVADRAILDVASGGATFASEVDALGGRVVACDPVYARPPAEVLGLLRASLEETLTYVQSNPREYAFVPYGAPWVFTAHRRRTYRRFKTEYLHAVSGRGAPLPYVAAVPPLLPFADRSFDLALTSHLLFAHSEEAGLDAHVDAIAELVRVADEARIFPLGPLRAHAPVDVGAVLGELAGRGIEIEVRRTGYEMRPGANEMLVAWPAGR